MIEYAHNLAGILALAVDEWKHAHDQYDKLWYDAVEAGVYTGICRGLSRVLEHATGQRGYHAWIESIIDLEPVGPKNWPTAISYLKSRAGRERLSLELE